MEEIELDPNQPIPKSCYPGFFRGAKHVWGPWKETKSGDIVRGASRSRVGKWIEMERKCTKCGELEGKTVEYD